MIVRIPVRMNALVRERENSTPWVLLVTYSDEDQITGTPTKTPATSGPPRALIVTTAATPQPPNVPLQIIRVALNLVGMPGASLIPRLLCTKKMVVDAATLTTKEKAKLSGAKTATSIDQRNQNARAASIRIPNRICLGKAYVNRNANEMAKAKGKSVVAWIAALCDCATPMSSRLTAPVEGKPPTTPARPAPYTSAKAVTAATTTHPEPNATNTRRGSRSRITPGLHLQAAH